MAFDEGLAGRIRDLLQYRQRVTERKMFGGLAFMLNGHLLVGILGDTLLARVGVNHYFDALNQPHTREMDFTGKPMKGYVYVAPQGFESDSGMEQWLNRCTACVESLPPKPKKSVSP
jgi:hypothetical protein